MKLLRQINKHYRQILIASLISSGSLLPLVPALADQNSAAPGVLENQATAQFIDSTDNTAVPIVSDIVRVTVAEIAGISAISSVVTPVAGTPYRSTTVNFDFLIRNEGNDPTQFFIPGAPSAITGGGVALPIQVIAYNTASPSPSNTGETPVTANNIVPTNGISTGGTGGLTGVPNGGSVPPGGYIKVRVPVTIPAGANVGDVINVTLGNTNSTQGSTNVPYLAGTNGTGTNDLYTQDNANGTGTVGTIAETDGIPFNGDTTNHRQEASAVGSVTVVAPPNVTISGKVWDDANGSGATDFTGIPSTGELGANVSPAINAILVDSITGKVLATTPVATSGTYTLTAPGANPNNVFVILNTSPGTVGSLPPDLAISLSLPTNWTNTTPTTYVALPFPLGIVSIVGKDFGIEQLPTAVATPAASQVNSTGVNQFTVPATVFTSSTDPDGTVASYKITAFPSNAVNITINGTTYTATTFAAAVTANGGVTFTLAQLNAGAVTIDPVDGASTVSIPFQAIDNAGKSSANTATGSMPFTAAAVTVSGTVIDDKDKSGATGFASIRIPAGELGTDTKFGTNGTPIYATLYNVDTSQVIASQLIPSTGIYSFSNVPATTNVKAIISTTAGVANGAAPAIALPGGWVGTTAQDSGSFNTGLFPIANKDFGVIQRAKLVIVKRITKIGKTSGSMSTSNPNDNTPLTGSSSDSFNFNPTKNPTAPAHTGNWPANYIVGATDAGKVLPGDFIEYTIYFMNNQGADAKNVKICDPIRGNQSYDSSSISLNLTSDPTVAGTAVPDTASRVNVFTGSAAPTNCNASAATSTGTNNGGVAIDITTIGTGTAATDQPVGVPGATGVGTANSYGLFRFRTQVKP